MRPNLLYTIALVGVVLAADPIQLSVDPPSNVSDTIRESFVSFSIEFSSFPDFAGNSSEPNEFSYNLLRNLGAIQGTNPIIRVGGNTQDYATFDADQQEALVGSYNFNRSKDYPTTISIGPAYFDSYNTWPGFRYLHGFNMGKNGSIGYDTLRGTVPLVCKALAGDKLASWTLGNEPDLFKTSAQGPVRPSWWNETEYVAEYLNKTRLMREIVQRDCPDVIEQGKFRFYSPSFAGTSNSLNLIKTFAAGLDTDQEIAFIDSHNYIGGATQPGVTLQGTLMNHTSTVASVNKHLNETTLLRSVGLPYLLGETNSLYNQGAPALSNSFGAALWGVDFNLYCAATGIARVHMHQGTNYRYASWQPIPTANETIGTKAPYYGNIAVANFLGNLKTSNTSVANIDLDSIYNAAYAAYVDDRLERIAVIQMQAYNYTDEGSASERPSESFSFRLPDDCGVTEVDVQRLMANGSNAITGITYDGVSYNHELDLGKPVPQDNVTTGEVLKVGNGGSFEVEVPWSSAVILQLKWE